MSGARDPSPWLVMRLASLLPAVLAFALTAGDAYAADAGTVYVTVGSKEAVVPIDPRTDAPGTPIPVGKYPAGIAITPDGRSAYVASYFNTALTPIDLGTGSAGTPLPIASEDVAISPDGASAYVASSGSVIPVALPADVAGAPIPVGEEVRDVAFAPDGATAYAVNGKSRSLTPIDTRTRTPGTPIPLGGHPVAMAITPDGRTGYVVDESTPGQVLPVDLATGAVGTPIAVGKNPAAIAITPDGRRAYVTYPAGNAVIPLDLTTNTTGAAIFGGTFPLGIGITPDGRRAYATDYFGRTVTPIDTATGSAGTAIEVGEASTAVAAVPSQPPQPEIAGPDAAAPGERLAFDGSASRAPLGAIVAYEWSFGDGTVATGPTAAHAYAEPGTYRVTLTVDNGDGCPGFVYTGHTAYCNGPSRTSASRTVTVSIPRPATVDPSIASTPAPPRPTEPLVRVHCPRRAGKPGCRLSLVAVDRRPRPGAKRPPAALSATARTRLAAGATALLTLRPKPAFTARLATARRILVREKATIGGRTTVTYRMLPVVAGRG